MFKNILIVEKKEQIREKLAAVLEKNGYTVTSGKNAKAVQELLEKQPIDLVLSHIDDEKEAGFEILRLNKETHPCIPTVLIGRHHFDETILRAIGLGMFDCLVEPIHEADLLQTIKRAEYFSHAQRVRNKFPEKVKGFSIKVEFHSSEFELEDIQKIFQDAVLNYSRMSPDDFLTVWLAVEEALINAHEHGNLELHSSWKDELLADGTAFSKFEKMKAERAIDPIYASRSISLDLRMRRGEIEVRIADHGDGFALEKIECGVMENVYGRGLTIIDSIMDKMEFNERGNEIIMRKSFVPMS